MPATSKIAILGTGVLARQLMRKIIEDQVHELCFIADVYGQYSSTSQMAEDLAYHLKYDTIYHNWITGGRHTVDATSDSVIVDGRVYKCFVESDAANLPCASYHIDVVIDCSGIRDNGFVQSGVQASGGKTTIATTTPTPSALTNNYHDYKGIVTPINDIAHGQCAVLSGGDIVARALMLHVVENSFSVQYAYSDIRQSNTNYEYVQDYPSGSADSSSRACDNIVYEGTSTDTIMGYILPQFNGKVFRSYTRLTNKNTNSILFSIFCTTSYILSAVKAGLKAGGTSWMEFIDDDIVSSDYDGSDTIGICFGKVATTASNGVFHFNIYYDTIKLQVRNILAYVDSHSGDWTN